MTLARLLAAAGLTASLLVATPATAAAPDAPTSTYFSTVNIEEHESVGTTSDGDLWPSCWSNDNNLYTANGDGKGFTTGGDFADVAVNQLRGNIPNLTGDTIARGDAVSQVWSGPGYTRKPTGMACVNGTLYLAVQDLALDFNEVPAATIVKSTDHGRTWTWDKTKPMFGDHVFTTIFFADFGKDSAWAPDKYVYAYGLDNNWRDSFDDRVPDPADVYLARVPKTKIQDRTAWEFFTGSASNGTPRWTKNISKRAAVLHDGRKLYQQTFSTNSVSNLSVISQGGVTYDKPLKRYLYTSWTEFTFEFYESPTPWGPWKRFLSKDFGGYPWSASKHGGYGTTIPSKFLSTDGRTAYVQANVCPCGGGGSVYHYSLRKMQLAPAVPSTANNPPDGSANLATAAGTVPISKSARLGRLDFLNDGNKAQSEDDNDGEVKPASWWGYTWPRQYTVNRVDFTSGEVSGTGGWFTGRPRVQLRQNGEWVDAAAQSLSPTYPGDSTAGSNQTYTITFKPAAGDGVRVIGLPGGTRTYTSIAELTASYASQLVDGGFEAPASGPSAWDFEGTAGHGVDRGLGFAHSGQNNGWIRTSGTGWSALTQKVPVSPGKTYTFAAWDKSAPTLTEGRFGVRVGDTVLSQTTFAATDAYAQRKVTVTIPAGVTSVTVFAGFVGPGTDTWMQLDDVTIS